ncbi:hypothetical protein AUC45_08840 [Erythrobacter sp. YT30]|nr:hypothetical protein AUC45_08840 [Erythrobacter sp. YT30]
MGSLIRSLAPDIVHSFTHRANVVAYLTLRGEKKIRFIPNVTGAGRLFENDAGPQTKLKRRALLMLYSAMASRCEVIYFQNETDALEIGGAMDLSSDQLRVTNGSGLSPSSVPSINRHEIARFRDALSLEHGIDPGRRIFLFPARALYSKGVSQFYFAALRYIDLFDDAAFLHAGLTVENSPLGLSEADIMSMSRPNISYIGFRTDLSLIMQAAACIVLPSYYREGTPRALIEGLFQKKPIITTDMPGCRDTVIDGWNGYVVKPRSGHDLLSAFTRFREADGEGMGDNSALMFEKKYHAEKVVSDYLELYESPVISHARKLR